MDITFLGAGTVRLSGKNINVVCDPFDDGAGLGKMSARADVVTQSAPEGFNSVAGAMTIEGPGEYEVAGSMITGVPAQLATDEAGRRGSVYSIMIDGVNVVVTGNIAGKLDESEVETLGKVDVLVVPVGGHGLTLEPDGAAAVTSQLEPSYVIPVHYDDGDTKYPVPQAPLSEFLKEMGSTPEPVSRLKVNAKEFPEETQVVVLQRS